MGGQDKGWCLYHNQAFIKVVLQQLQQQIKQIDSLKFKLIISANRNLADYQQLDTDVEVVSDERQGFCGPLAGIEAVMKSDFNTEVSRWITYPVDSLEVPEGYLKAMSALNSKKIGYVVQAGKKHFAHLSIPASQQAVISSYLDREKRSIKGWLIESGLTQEIEFLDYQTTILNINV